MKKHILLPISAILLSLSLVACSSGMKGSAPQAVAPAPSSGVSEPAGRPDYEFGGIAESPSKGGDSSAPSQQVRDSKLILRASLTMESQEFDAAVAALDQLVKAKGGYYESNNLQQNTYYDADTSTARPARFGDFTIRLPKDQFEPFLGAAGDVGHIINSSRFSEDVGDAYYDTELRLKTQQTKHERLLSLLEKADNMENIIALENALSNVEYEIERLTGSLRNYDSLVGYSTITVRLNEVLKLTEQPKATASLGGRIANAFSGGLKAFGEGLGNLAVWGAYHFVGVLVFLAVAAVAAVLARREYRKRRPTDTNK